MPSTPDRRARAVGSPGLTRVGYGCDSQALDALEIVRVTGVEGQIVGEGGGGDERVKDAVGGSNRLVQAGIDVGAELHRVGSGQVLEQCHQTRSGHRRLADRSQLGYRRAVAGNRDGLAGSSPGDNPALVFAQLSIVAYVIRTLEVSPA